MPWRNDAAEARAVERKREKEMEKRKEVRAKNRKILMEVKIVWILSIFNLKINETEHFFASFLAPYPDRKLILSGYDPN